MKINRILFVICLFIAGCEENKVTPDIDTGLSGRDLPTQESWNSKVVFSEDGELKAVLYADHLRMYEDKKETLIEGVKIDFYDEEEKKTSTLTSKRGRVDDATRNMYAIDSVVAVSDSGVILRTDELYWNNNDQKIRTDKFVRVISDTEIIEGYGFESDQHLQNYVIFNITYNTKLKEEKNK